MVAATRPNIVHQQVDNAGILPASFEYAQNNILSVPQSNSNDFWLTKTTNSSLDENTESDVTYIVLSVYLHLSTDSK